MHGIDDRPTGDTPYEQLARRAAMSSTGLKLERELADSIDSWLASLAQLPSPEHQQQLARIAQAAAADYAAPLQLVLRTRRFALRIPADEAARAAGLSTEKLQGLETGAITLWEVGSKKVAEWILSLDVSTVVALRALRNAMGLSTPASAAAYAHADRKVEASEAFVAEVETLVRASRGA